MIPELLVLIARPDWHLWAWPLSAETGRNPPRCHGMQHGRNLPHCPGGKRESTAGSVASVVRISGHGGVHALAAARRHGVSALFTLSGGHVFPLYDAAVKGGQPLRLVDVRHEQTAVFAAEATARLTRVPGLAVVTAVF